MNFQINPNFWADLILMAGGFIFSFCQLIYEAYNRREKVNWKKFLMKLPMMVVAILVINAIGPNFPADCFPWSPGTAVVAGYLNFQLLTGFIRFKSPAGVDPQQ